MAKKVERPAKTRFKVEKVRDAKEKPGAARKAERVQAGKFNDFTPRPNSGVND